MAPGNSCGLGINNGRRNKSKMAQGTLMKGQWSAEEDELLREHVRVHGEGGWNSCRILSRLRRCGKSCRLRWVNHLRPNLKKGPLSAEEQAMIVRLHDVFGSKWALIASQLSGRTDNEIKNYWHMRSKKRQRDSSNNRIPLLTPCSPSVISIYDISRSWSSSRTSFLNNSRVSETYRNLNLFYQNNGLSYEQNGADFRQIQPSDDSYAPITTSNAFGNIDISGYVPVTPNEAGLSYEQNGAVFRQIQPSADSFAPIATPNAFGNTCNHGYVSVTPIEAGDYASFGLPGNLSLIHEGTQYGSSSFVDAATAVGSHVHASTGAASLRETDQMEDDFLSLLCTTPLAGMNNWFDNNGTIAPEHTPSFGGWC